MHHCSFVTKKASDACDSKGKELYPKVVCCKETSRCSFHSPRKISKLAKVNKKSLRKIVSKKKVPSKYKLHVAIEEGNVERVKKVLNKYSQYIEQQDENHHTPLQIACVKGDVEIVQLLLKAGCDINARDREGWTALHFICTATHENVLELCQIMIRSDAFVGASNNSGSTALHYIVANRFVNDSALFLDILSSMIVHGADVNCQNKNGETPLHKAAASGREDSIVILCNTQGANLNTLDKHGETCLHSAARAGHVHTVQILLHSGVNSAIIGKNGTCLEVAEKEGHFKLIDLLRAWEAAQRNSSSELCKPIESTLSNSITIHPKIMESIKIMGIDTSVAIGCLYQLQSRGEPTDDVHLLIEEVNKQQKRECSVCLCNPIDSLYLPCRHSATCLECARNVVSLSGSCPICREKISEVMQIFIS